MQDNYFDRIVREKLSQMEVSFEPSDWEVLVDRMSASLDALFRARLEQESVPFEPADWELMEAMLDAPFDHAIGEKLRTVTVPFAEADWAAMELALDASFDRVVRDKLMGVEVPFLLQDWAAMDAALQHPFDQVVGERLAEMQIPYAAADWEVMNDQLNAPFDAAVREKLDSHQSPFFKSDWRRMAALLGRGRMVPLYRDWRTYAAAAVLLLLFLAGGEWRKMGPDPSHPFISQKQQPVFEQQEQEASVHAENIPSLTVTPSVQEPPSLLSENTDEVSPAAFDAPVLQNTHALNDLQPGSPKRILASKNPIPTTVEVPGDQPIAEKATKQAENRHTYSLNGIRLHDQQSGVGLLGYNRFDAQNSTHIEIPGPPAFPKVGVSLYGAGFSSVSQFNEKGKAGFATGLRVDLILSDNWTLVSGVLYAQKQFSRTVFNSVPSENGIGTSLTPTYTYWISKLEAEYTLLEIPLLARYTFRNESPVSFYLQAGFTTMLSLRESYQHYDPRSASNVNQTENNSQVDPSVYSSALVAYLDQLSPTPEERKINTYIGNLQFGPGLEVRLNPQLQLYLEPYLQLGVLPMGAERLKMHSAGLGMGIQYLLGK